MDKTNKYQQLLNNSIIYSIGNFGSSFVNFLMLPLYTYTLTTYQYGSIDIIQTLIDLSLPILSLNLSDAILRFTLDDKYNKQKLLSTSFIIPIFTIPVFYAILFIIKIFIPLNISLELICLIIIFKIYNEYLKQFVRGINKNITFALNDIFYTVCFASFNLIFLLILKVGISGYFYSIILALLISNIYLYFSGKVSKYLSYSSFSKDYFQDTLSYSIPLIPNTIMWWIMNAIDRYFILFFLSVESNGLYGIAYKLPSLISIITSIFAKAWQISAIKEYNKKDTLLFFNNVFQALVSILIISVSLVFCVLPFFIKFIISNSYKGVINIIPFLFISVIFSSLSSFVGTNYLASKQTKGTIKTSLSGGMANIIGNIILIPIIGLAGAAVSTAISFFVVLMYRIYDTKDLIKIKISKTEILNVLLVIFQAIILTINEKFYIVQFIIFIIILCINFKILNVLKNNLLKGTLI